MSKEDTQNNKITASEPSKEDEKLKEASVEDEELEAILHDVPEEVKKFMRMSSTSIRGSAPHPVMEKINAEHIDKVLSIAEKSDENEFKNQELERKHNRKILFWLALFLLIIIVGGFFAKENDSVLKILTGLAIFAGGFGAKELLLRK